MEIDWASGTIFGFPFSTEVVGEVGGGVTRGRETASDLVRGLTADRNRIYRPLTPRVALVARMRQHGVKSTGSRPRYLDSHPIPMLVSSVALNKSLGLSILFYLVDNELSLSIVMRIATYEIHRSSYPLPGR